MADDDGEVVGRWEDLTANSDHVNQTTDDYKPTLQTAELNGQDVLRFDGSNDYLQGTFANGGTMIQPNTIFVVAKLDASVVNSGPDSVLIDGIANGVRNLFYKYNPLTGTDYWRMFSGVNQSGGAADSNWNIWTLVFNDDFGGCWKNGVVKINADVGSNSLTGLTVGRGYIGSSWYGDIAEIIVYDANLSDTDKNEVGQYLSDRYGISYTVIGSSPSASVSLSPSASISLSPSVTPSASVSLSPSVSESLSASLSPSLSVSNSPSISVSASVSASPSVGYVEYTRGDYAELPTDDTDLDTQYSEQDYVDVDSNNDVRVTQCSTGAYAVHQFREFAEADSCTITWEGQTDLNPSNSPVVMQIYNYNNEEWELLQACSTENENSDFSMVVGISNLSNYKSPSGLVTVRVYQNMSNWSPAMVTTDGGLSPAHWYRADAGFQDTARTTPATEDGQQVQSWTDNTSNADHLSKLAGAVAGPVLATVNGQKTLRFDETDQRIVGAFTRGGVIAQPYTLFIVAKKNVATDEQILLLDGNSTSNRLIVRQYTVGSGNWEIAAGAVLAGGNSDANWNIWTCLLNGSSSQFWHNGISEASGNAGANSWGGMTVAHIYSGSGRWVGDVSEIIAYAGNLSTADKNQVGKYLATRYSLTYTEIV